MKSLLVLGMILAPTSFAKTIVIQPGETVKVGTTKVSCSEESDTQPAQPAQPVAPPRIDCTAQTPNGMGLSSHGYSMREARGNLFRSCAQNNPTSIGFPEGTKQDKVDELCERMAAIAVCN